MISLKSGCTNLNFKNMEKIPSNYKFLLYNIPSKENIDEQLKYWEELVGDDLQSPFIDNLNYIKRLKSDPNFQDGKLPRGLEAIVLQIIESYAFWHALHEVSDDNFIVQDNYFHNLINVSINTMISCELAKLLSRHSDDFSLTNIWEEHLKELKLSNITDNEEIDYITQVLRRDHNVLPSEMRNFTNFRNKSIAHNQYVLSVGWSDFKVTINFILRAFAILDEYYSPNSFPRPVMRTQDLFQNIQKIIKTSDIAKAKQKREELMSECFEAASKNLITKQKGSLKPFNISRMKVTIKHTNMN
ncbi:hypothetical protein [Pseudoalteromonas sp. B160]|uniref:hypothetical protein n=1 Tax=Pseudoalteromonas sp. B160 TaxID=630414 RepID=UPI00301DB815